MNRRQFLTRALSAVPVIAAGDQLVELLAPKRTIFLPPRGGWWGRQPMPWRPGHWMTNANAISRPEVMQRWVDMNRAIAGYKINWAWSEMRRVAVPYVDVQFVGISSAWRR